MNIRLTILLLLLPVLALGQPLSVQVFPYSPSGSNPDPTVWTDDFQLHSANVAVWDNSNWAKADDSIAVIDVSGDKVVKSGSSSRSCARWVGGGNWTSDSSHYSQVTVETFGNYGFVGPAVCIDEDSANYYQFVHENGNAWVETVVDGGRTGYVDNSVTAPSTGTIIKLGWIFPDTLRLYYNGVLVSSFGSSGTAINGTLQGGTTKAPGIGGYGQGSTHYSNDWEGGYE